MLTAEIVCFFIPRPNHY